MKNFLKRSPYSQKGRIGLICPSTNTSIEPEFNMMAPNGISTYVARAFQDGPQAPALYKQIAKNVAKASRDLGSAQVDVIAFGCTSCSYFTSADETKKVMKENAKGATPILTSDSVVKAIRTVGAKKIALATPRTEFVNKRETEWLTEHGFEVVSVKGLQLGSTGAERASIGYVSPETVNTLVMNTDKQEADAIFISCTNLPSLTLIHGLEKKFRKPVITSNQATFWNCLRTLGIDEKICGYGILLENF
ncbi:MAG: decarboxylase [Rhodospirillaceae bacterium]|nr:decarboxylase [Rhodospirillaceae bacterium]|tara:strand:- start:46 stop:792 length:747 start_codon:yes stop_codon:yes gene_type:complete